MPAGLDSTFYIPGTTLKDNLVEGTETLSFTIEPGEGYVLVEETEEAGWYFSTASIFIADDPPVVSIEAIDTVATEPEVDGTYDTGRFKVKRTGGDLSEAIEVTLDYNGTAELDIDYVSSHSQTVSVTSETLVEITALDDGVFDESTETVIPTLASGDNYVTGSPASTTVNLQDVTYSYAITPASRTINRQQGTVSDWYVVSLLRNGVPTDREIPGFEVIAVGTGIEAERQIDAGTGLYQFRIWIDKGGQTTPSGTYTLTVRKQQQGGLQVKPATATVVVQ